jgi:hypothetical protein
VVFEKECIMQCSSAEWIARNGCARDDAIVVLAGKLRKLWDSLSELRSSLCERWLAMTVLRPALLPVKNCAVYSVFPSGMTSHSKIAQFNWECIGHFKSSPLELLMLNQMSPFHTLIPNLFITYFSNIIPIGLLDVGSPSNTQSKFIVLLILICICACT